MMSTLVCVRPSVCLCCSFHNIFFSVFLTFCSLAEAVTVTFARLLIDNNRIFTTNISSFTLGVPVVRKSIQKDDIHSFI